MSQHQHNITPLQRATDPAVTEAAPTYYGILTAQGQTLLADAIANATPLPLTQMAVGDGGGAPITPQAEMTELVNEVYRAPLNQLFVDPTATNQIVAEMIMTETVGGFWIRELGLFAESGELFAVCNTPDSLKPLLEQGAGRSLLSRMVLIVSDTAAVELIINPDTVMASRAYVDAKLAEHAASRDHPAATEGAQGMIPLATQAMVNEGTDHTSAVTPQTAGITFARLQHEHEIDDVLWLQEALDSKAAEEHTHTPQEAGAAPAIHEHEIDDVLGLEEALSGKQSLDATLTALAGLTTAPDKLPFFTGADQAAVTALTAFARQLLDDANASAMLTTLGVSTFIKGLLDDADAAAARVTLGAQASDATLTALAGLATAADKLPFFTGADQAAVTALTAFARQLLDDANASAMLTTLGVSTFIKGLLDDADAATARGTLGVTSYNLTGDASAQLSTTTDVLEYFRTNPQAVFRTVGAGSPNAPAGFSAGPLFFQVHGVSNGAATYGALTAIDAINHRYWVNILKNGVWQGWARVYTTAHPPTAEDVGALPASGKTVAVTASDPLVLSGTSPTIKFAETDTGKAYHLIVDASGIRINEDLSTGTYAWQYDAATNLFKLAATPPAGDNSTNAATTAFVMANSARLSHTHTAAQGNSDIVASGYGQIGTYGLLRKNSAPANIGVGEIHAGSGLSWASCAGNVNLSPAGSWKCVGHVNGSDSSNSAEVTLWLRVA